MDNFYHWQGETLHLNIYLQPNANKDGIVGEFNGMLKVKVKAPATKNKANQSLIALLAKIFLVPLSRISFVNGRRSQRKCIIIDQPQKLIKQVVKK